MKKLLLILLCLPMIGFGQNVNIPDANFKAYLVGNSAINTNGDSEIQVSEANSFGGAINCPNMNITDLTGIEYFVALTELICYDNQLTSIDVSQNIALTILNCSGLQSGSLNVSNNIALLELACEGCNLSILDVTSNVNLLAIGCESNYLTSLNLSNNSNLVALNCSDNLLTSLNLTQNFNLVYFTCQTNELYSLNIKNTNNTQMQLDATDNPNLTCINVDDSLWSTANWSTANGNIDSQHFFSTNCSGTASIRDNLNVTNLTDNGTGYITINITNSMSNDDYVRLGTAGENANTGGNRVVGLRLPSTGSFNMISQNTGGSSSDTQDTCVAIFGDLA